MSSYINFRKSLDLAKGSRGALQLIIVSKQKSVSSIKELYDLGERHFAENRVLELLEKVSSLPSDITWHYVGKLQKNKVNKILDLSPVIHSIDSIELAKTIEEKASKPIKGFLQVNISKEESKSGIFLEDLEEALDAFCTFKYLDIIGLMTMAPIKGAKAKEVFQQLKDQEVLFCKKMNKENCKFSMGMSQDYKEAILCGATHIRIGRAIFND